MKPAGWAGIAAGGVAALSWSIYNVAAKLGAAQGFQPQDLMLARFAGAGLLMLPVLLRYGLRDLGGVGWGRAVILTVLIGPLFGFLVGVGFVLAPLAHGLVVGPSTTMIATSLFACWFAGEPISRQRVFGIAILAGGLQVLAAEGATEGGGGAMGGMVLVGDLAFMASACLWAGFTLLIGRWGIDPLRGTAAVSVLAMAVVIPLHAALFEMPPVSLAHWVSQAAFQGGLGGCVAVLAFGVAVRRLGPARAGLFPSMVPPLGILVSIPILGHLPGAGQIAGVALASLGLMVGLGGFPSSRKEKAT